MTAIHQTDHCVILKSVYLYSWQLSSLNGKKVIKWWWDYNDHFLPRGRYWKSWLNSFSCQFLYFICSLSLLTLSWSLPSVQTSGQTELENWITAIHSACATALARQHHREDTVRLLRTEIRKLEQKIDMDEKMKKMGDMQLSTVTDGKKRKTILEQVWGQSGGRLGLKVELSVKESDILKAVKQIKAVHEVVEHYRNNTYETNAL